MSASYPSSIASLTNPVSTDTLHTTPHSTIETIQYDVSLVKEYSLEELKEKLENANTSIESWNKELLLINENIAKQEEQIKL
jgi:uncharacterized protein YlzI (FlbEa/FlbD family)